MKNMTIRHTNIIAFFLCIALLTAAYYFQYVQLLEPCPLCLIQRFVVLVLAMLFLLGIQLRRQLYVGIQSSLVMIVAIAGMVVAGRKVWLELHPSDVFLSCTPGLEYMVENFPFHQTINLLFQGDGDCSITDWVFLGLSMSSWVFLFFLAFAIFGAIHFVLNMKSKR